MSQGAGQGIEDAATLAEILSRITSSEQIPEATRHFESFRKLRAETMVQFAVQNGSRMSLPDGPQQQDRDQLMAIMSENLDQINWDRVKPDQTALLGTPSFFKWLYSHNIMEEVRHQFSILNHF